MTDRLARTALEPAHGNAESRRAIGLDPAFTQETTLSIVIPCYNESAGLVALRGALLPVVERLCKEHAVELVLVDDGSQDGTFDQLTELFPASVQVPVRIVRHDQNQGLSSALRSAARVATGEVILTLDADCTYHPDEVFGLLATMRRSGADVVTGSPYHPEGGVENVQGWRLAMSRGASRIYGALVPEKLYCYTSMFRAYRRDWFRPEFITSDHFVGVTEVLVHAILAGAKVSEYPVVLRRRVYGDSKLKVGRATLEHLRLMGKIALRVKPHQGDAIESMK
jgi:dolichol-phosphate mannosyltransferase